MDSKPRKAWFWRRIAPPTDLFAAIDRGSVAMCQEILRGDSTALSHTDELGRTPLHVAAHKGRKEIVALFLSARANLQARDSVEATPLHWAAVGGNGQVIEALVAAGADLKALEKHGFTPAQLAEMRGHPEAAALLRRHERRR